MAKGTVQSHRLNEQIRITPVRVIGAEGEQVGIIDTKQAQFMARESGLDLVEIAPNERPPVCRIMDYGKYKYQLKKKQKGKTHEQQLKEVRLRPKTDAHDKEIKINRALKFLSKGDKVQFTMQFRGRERAHREVGVNIFNIIIDELGELVKVERRPSMDGRHMIMILAPNKPAFEKLAKEGKAPKLDDIVDEEDDDLDEDVIEEERDEVEAQ